MLNLVSEITAQSAGRALKLLFGNRRDNTLHDPITILVSLWEQRIARKKKVVKVADTKSSTRLYPEY